jgi:molecular chaperone GrpE
MSRKTRAEERIEQIDVSPAALSAELEAAREARDDAQRQVEEYVALLQRERAEFANFRRRTAEERERELGLAGEDLIRKTIALADDFDRAVETRPTDLQGNAWVEGVAAIDRKLRQLLESEGVRAIDAAPGRPFDPREHEAVANVPGTGRREGEIVEEIRRGYRLRDRVIRPALVAVAEGSGSSDEGDQPPERKHDADRGDESDRDEGPDRGPGPGRAHDTRPGGDGPRH